MLKILNITKGAICTKKHKNSISFWASKFDLYDNFKKGGDEFLALLCQKRIYCNVCDIVKLVCTLSHGQSSVERAFSINKEYLN